MQVDSDHLTTVFKKIRNFQEYQKTYFIESEEFPIKWQTLVRAFTHMYQCHISIRKVSTPFPSYSSLKGMLLRYSGTREKPHVIRVKSNLSEDNEKFTIVKEMSHLLIDEKEDWCPDGVNVLAGMFELFTLEKNGHTDSSPDRNVTSEILAELVATELLYPYVFRASDLRKIASGETSIAKISLEYAIPPWVVSKALSGWYQKMCDHIWSNVENE